MSSSHTPERDTHLIDVGKQCSSPSCLLVDFLPFKCQHCELSYCQEHFRVTAHNCTKYDESKYNKVAPSCPLCNTPVAVRSGQDPNARMEDHFAQECSVMTGKSGRTKSAPTCGKRNCKKVLFAPISCKSCKDQFCPTHRFPADHNCPSLLKPAAAPNPAAAVKSKWANIGIPTMGTINQTISANVPVRHPAPATSRVPAAKPATPLSHSNPFSKSDRRAKAERESRRKAMQERAKKGLLSEEEKAILAAEENERKMHPMKKDDCTIM